MVTHISRSPQETEALGELWGRQASAGWVIGLSGELGSGKTQLVKGFARGLGIPDLILSPTFVLVREYQTGRLPLYHLDLYRLENSEQVIASGLQNYFAPREGVSIVEWVDRCDDALLNKKHYRHVVLSSIGPDERSLCYEDSGS